jgi:drug/metabolite transporter (DMT)-like permease
MFHTRLASSVSRRQIGLISGIASGACYGGMIFLIHIMAGRAPASEITFLRAISAVVTLLPFIVRHGRRWLERKALLLWFRSLVGAVSVLCLAWNLQHTSVGFANTLFNLAPILVVMLGAKWGQERLEPGRFASMILVVLASVLFWHGSRSEAGVVIWAVGLSGMCAAAVAYSLLKSLPSFWNPFDITWCLNLATVPVALLFKHGSWVVPAGNVALLLGVICVLSIVGNALANLSFRYLELSTATALVPSAIIWGVLLDVGQHNFPPIQGVAGCLLYLVATIHLATRPPTPVLPSVLSVAPTGLTE